MRNLSENELNKIKKFSQNGLYTKLFTIVLFLIMLFLTGKYFMGNIYYPIYYNSFWEKTVWTVRNVSTKTETSYNSKKKLSTTYSSDKYKVNYSCSWKKYSQYSWYVKSWTYTTWSNLIIHCISNNFTMDIQSPWITEFIYFIWIFVFTLLTLSFVWAVF